MSASSRRRFAAGVGTRIALLLALTGCGADDATPSAPGPAAPDLARFLTGEHVDGVAVTVAVTPAVAQPRDTVHLVATARNATPRRLQIGVQCGPALDVLVTTPEGRVRSALADATGGGIFTCELGPQHFVEPGGARVVRIAWVAPTVRGDYAASAGLRRAGGLGNPSAAARFSVR